MSEADKTKKTLDSVKDVSEDKGKSKTTEKPKSQDKTRADHVENLSRERSKSRGGDKIEGSVDHEHAHQPYAEENEPFVEEVHDEPENFDGFLEEIKKNVSQYDLVN